MKNHYTISEVSKLYHIGVDSLRYYERLGILHPQRGENNYRMYRLQDMYKLNIIQDLRKFNFSMAQIKEYLDIQTIDNTLDILQKEQTLLEKQLLELKIKEEVIKSRIASLTTSRTIEAGSFRLKTFPRRFCVQLNAHITRDEEMDFLVEKLLEKHEDKVRDLGNQTIGALVSTDAVLQGISNVYRSVFFILNEEVLTEETSDYDYALPAGTYLSYYYRGGYAQNADCLKKVLDYPAQHGLTAAGELFELYEIDNRDTTKESEFLTEIQILVTPASESYFTENCYLS